jgi:hypothetical protein
MDFRHGDLNENWYELQAWARQSTAGDALFIEPPTQKGFRVESLRSSYGNWHDGTKAFFSENYAELWWSRMSNLQCTDPDQLANDYRKNTAEDFETIWSELSSEYSEGYVICFADMPLKGLEPVFENEDFLVYRL